MNNIVPSFVYLIFSKSGIIYELLNSGNKSQVSVAFNKSDYSEQNLRSWRSLRTKEFVSNRK